MKKRTFNDRFADHISALLGNMRFFWVSAVLYGGWILFMQLTHGIDAWPFPFLLFCSNVVQYFYLPVLQNTSNRQTDMQQKMLLHIEQVLERLEREERRKLQEDT